MNLSCLLTNGLPKGKGSQEIVMEKQLIGAFVLQVSVLLIHTFSQVRFFILFIVT